MKKNYNPKNFAGMLLRIRVWRREERSVLWIKDGDDKKWLQESYELLCLLSYF
jgi:hypothetical protein